MMKPHAQTGKYEGRLTLSTISIKTSPTIANRTRSFLHAHHRAERHAELNPVRGVQLVQIVALEDTLHRRREMGGRRGLGAGQGQEMYVLHRGHGRAFLEPNARS